MIFRTDLKEAAQKDWHPRFAWFPTRMWDGHKFGATVWLETYERREKPDNSMLWERRLRQ